MTTIEIVSHAYAMEMKHFASSLVFQISSLVLNKPKNCKVQLVVCHHAKDLLVEKVLKWALLSPLLHHVEFIPLVLVEGRIGRRSIGRNMAARMSNADIVWFADVDQVFRNGVLDRLAEMEWPDGASMVFPGTIKIHKNHATGDALLYGLDGPKVVDIDPEDFIEKRYHRAIGGVQIVQGDFAREHGYLGKDPKWQQPTDKPFGDFRDDVAYRKFCEQQGSVEKVDLPGMFRLRHTTVTYR